MIKKTLTILIILIPSSVYGFKSDFIRSKRQFVGKLTSLAINLTKVQGYDSLDLILFCDAYISNIVTPNKYIKISAPVRNGKSFFQVKNLHNLYHYSIVGRDKSNSASYGTTLIDQCIVEPGDNVKIDIEDKRILFNGKGAEKMSFIASRDQLYLEIKDSLLHRGKIYNDPNIYLRNIKQEFDFSYKACDFFIKLIDNNGFEKIIRDLLKVDFLGYVQNIAVRVASLEVNINNRFKTEDELTAIKTFIDNHFIKLDLVTDDLKGKSGFWLELILNEIRLRRKFSRQSTYPYHDLLLLSNSLLKDKIITSFLYSGNGSKYSSENLILQAKSAINNDYLSNIVSKLEVLTKGKPAMNFILEDTIGNLICLSDYKYKVVFIDFWFPHCVPCMKYYAGTISKVENHFNNNPNVIFISICIEKDKTNWLKAIKSNLYTSSTNAINLYTGPEAWQHDVVKGYSITGAPTPFLIDKKGRIYSRDILNLGLNDMSLLIKAINTCFHLN